MRLWSLACGAEVLKEGYARHTYLGSYLLFTKLYEARIDISQRTTEKGERSSIPFFSVVEHSFHRASFIHSRASSHEALPS